MFSKLMTDAQREALAKREAAMNAMETQRKAAGWPPYVMAELLSKATGKTVEARAIPGFNRSTDYGDKIVHNPTYEIGAVSGSGKFKPITTIDITYLQPKSGDGNFGVNVRFSRQAPPLKTNQNGEFIGELMPKEAMQRIIDVLGLADKVNKATEEPKTHRRFTGKNSDGIGR